MLGVHLAKLRHLGSSPRMSSRHESVRQPWPLSKERGWYARTLLRQRFRDPYVASQMLIENSRELIRASRQLIARSTATVVCGRSAAKYVN
jgi:hypothetical protein